MKYRVPILCLLLFLVMCLHTNRGQWVGDFWDHSSVVRELSTHPLHPKHPQLLLDAPHAFYTPYTLAVALAARVLKVDPVSMLAGMGLVNLGLLILGLRVFVFATVPTHRKATFFYTLLLMLCGWGSNPWFYSGFLHLAVLGYVLPYPSIFAAAVAMIAIGVNRLRLETHRQLWLGPLFLMVVIVLISHPITFIFLAVGICAQACAEKDSMPLPLMLAAALLGAAFLFALCWPYFPLQNVLMGETEARFHAANAVMYKAVVARIWPALVGIPLAIAGMRSNWRRPLPLMLIMLSGIYVFGAMTGKYTYGRVIAFIVLVLHVTIATHLAMLESWACNRNSCGRFSRLVVPAGVIAVSCLLCINPSRTTLATVLRERPPTYAPYLFLSRFVGQYDVVLSDIRSSHVVPTFGGKVVATLQPLALVPDQDTRRSDVERFFSHDATHLERKQIIHNYGVNYLLLNKSNGTNWHALQESFATQGHIVFESDRFVLISLKPKSNSST